MRKMRKLLKFLGYILATLVLIFFILPPILGIIAENKCQQIIKIVNTTTPLEVKIINYQKGWFRASATARVSLDKLKLPNPELYQFTINAEIMHGPLFMDWQKIYLVQALINADISLNPTQCQWLGIDTNLPKIANIKLRFKPSGEAKFILQSKPIAYHNQDNHLSWDGMQINATLSPRHTKIDSIINFTDLDIATKNYHFHLDAIDSVYHGQISQQSIWSGERDLQVKSLVITHNNNRTFFCDKLHLYNKTTNNTNDTIDFSLLANINKLNINNVLYNHGRFDLTITNAQKTLLTKLHELLFLNSVSFLGTGNLFDMALALASNGSTITIKQLDLDTPWGKLLSTVNIDFAQQTNGGLLAVVSNSTAHADFQVERPLLLHLIEKFYQNIKLKPTDNPSQQATSTLNKWEQSGKILTSDNDNYLHLNLRYQNQQLTINDKQLSLITKS